MPGSDSPLATGSRRALVSIAVAVFGVSLAIHVGVAFGFEQLGVFGQLNVLFDSDPFRYGLIYGQGLGQPTFAHPLPRLFVQPMVAAVASVLQAATGLEAAAARSLVVSLVCPLASALNASLLFLLFCLLGVGRRHALLLTLVVDLSFASIVIGSIPESYAIASVALTGSFVLAALECSGRARALGPWWIVAGVLCLGITASNVVPFALIYGLVRLDRGAGAREALLRTVVTLGTIAIAVAMGVGLERLVYEVPPARGHAGLEHVKRFANAETAERLWQIPAAYTNAVLASKPAVVPNSIQQGRWDYSIMFTFESDEISSLERVSRSLVTGLLIAFGIWGWGVSGAGRHPVFLAASGVLLFNFVLHTFWGKELFLYSPHWTTALGVLIAGGFRSTAGARAKMVGLVGFVLLLAVNDLWLVEGMNRVLERERRPQAAASHARAESPPNVVVIVSDDQGFTDFGFMGHPLLETPNLDRLAQQSLTFPNGYVPTALCRPSLATLLNGQYPHEHAIHFNDAPRGREAEAIALLDRHPTLPQLLGRAGYVSFQSGKHWEGSYQKAGFTRGMTHGDPDRGVEPHPTLTRLKARHGDRGLTIGRDGMGPVLEFLDEMERSREAPFLLWYAPFMPHQPFNAPASHRARYEGLGLHPRVAAYYAMVSWFDATVGELVDALESRGFDRDTLVVFVVDNGWATNTEASTPPYGPRSKGSPYEMGVRTPILLRWTGTIEPGIHTELASSIDIAPTILAAAGLDGEAKRMPGIDLFSLAKGEEGGDRRAVFGESYRRRPTTLDEPGRYLDARWVRAGNWKLIVGTDGSRHLYDLKNDPLEKRDLARDPRSRATIRTLERQLDAWWRP